MDKINNLALEILVIDDEPKNKIFVKDILKGAGMSVSWCRNWDETEQLLIGRINKELEMPDLILVDMYFSGEHCILGSNPGIEGLLIIDNLVKMSKVYDLKAPPIIGFTGTQQYMDAEAIIEYGASDFITDTEYKRPNHFSRRLIRSVMEAQFEGSFNRSKDRNLQDIEEGIVYKAMTKNNNDLKQAARLLRWPVNEVEKVAKRLETKGVY